eukprot:1158425-Pelagomonas_calceolata.AAC.3
MQQARQLVASRVQAGLGCQLKYKPTGGFKPCIGSRFNRSQLTSSFSTCFSVGGAGGRGAFGSAPCTG